MKTTKTIPLAVLLAAGLASLGAKTSCSCHFSTATISRATLTDKVDSDKVQAIGEKDVFSTTAEKIYYVITYKNCPKNTKIKATWKYLGGPSAAPPAQVIDKPVLKTVQGAGRIAFSLGRPNQGFPPGKYEVVVELNGKTARSQTFTIQGMAGRTSPATPAAVHIGPAARRSAPTRSPAGKGLQPTSK